jgi:hypothetical protein
VDAVVDHAEGVGAGFVVGRAPAAGGIGQSVESVVVEVLGDGAA